MGKCKEYTLDHITQENGKWFAEIKVSGGNGTFTKEHTGDIWGWKGLGYNSLRSMLSEYYNINIPLIKDLTLIKKTTCRKIYSVQ